MVSVEVDDNFGNVRFICVDYRAIAVTVSVIFVIGSMSSFRRSEFLAGMFA